MAEWVRVRDSSGHHISVRADVPEGHPRGVKPGMTRLKQDAVDASGDPLPPKYRTELGDGPASSARITAKPRRKAAKKAAQKPPATAAQSEATSGQQADTERQD